MGPRPCTRVPPHAPNRASKRRQLLLWLLLLATIAASAAVTAADAVQQAKALSAAALAPLQLLMRGPAAVCFTFALQGGHHPSTRQASQSASAARAG